MSSCSELAIKLLDIASGNPRTLSEIEIAVAMVICKYRLKSNEVIADCIKMDIDTNPQYSAQLIEIKGKLYLLASAGDNCYLDTIEDIVGILNGDDNEWNPC